MRTKRYYAHLLFFRWAWVNYTERRMAKNFSESALKFDLHWRQEGREKSGIPQLVVLDGPAARHSDKVAAFDVDLTILKPISGQKFPLGCTNMWSCPWEFFTETVPEKLRGLHNRGTKVVFFTNQAVIERRETTVEELCPKYEDLINTIGLPIQVFIAPGHTHYRKPSTGMWEYMETHCNGGIKVDRAASFFVGDAAGRARNWAPGKSEDFSSGDRMFAANLGIQFHTPEAYFLGEPEAPFEWRCINPQEYLKNVTTQLPPHLHSDSQEMVVIVGRPVSGKSFLCERFFAPHGYAVVTRDSLSTEERCEDVAIDYLKSGRSVVVDDTNPSRASRKTYVDIARKLCVPVRCLFLNVSQELASHLNIFREILTRGKRRRTPVIDCRVFDENFVVPDLSEGFTEIVTIDFVPEFESHEKKELFLQWATE